MALQNHLKKLILSNYFLIDSFVIFGSPASSKNNRAWTGNSLVLGEQAQNYCNIFDKQILRIKKNISAPYNMRDYLWVFEIWYENEKSDASIELIFDLMQKNIIIFNDNTIRNYLVLSESVDKITPRLIISIFKAKDGE